MKIKFILSALSILFMLPVYGQMPNTRRTVNDTLVSTEVHPDSTVTFRIYAPRANEVKLSGDLAGFGTNQPKFVKDDRGVWEGTFSHVKPGVYRYNFDVDGVRVNDPKARATRDFVPLIDVDPSGEEFWKAKDVPHGMVSQVFYHSKTFNTTRRMHVWIPAGNIKAPKKLPVLYLIHGGGDNDAAWPTVGRANFILDNLLAEGKIEPMIVVMPDGSVDVEKFTHEMMDDIIPYVEANFNVYSDSDHRALAGLSMGGLETLDISLNNYKSFAYVFPLSTGWFIGSAFFPKWEEYFKEHAADMNSYFKIYKFYMGGEEDIAYKNCIATRELFDKYKIKYQYSQMPGGHTWNVWRNNLKDFAPLLFR